MKIKGQKKLSISMVVIMLLLIIITAEIIVNTETKADYSGTTSDNLFEYTVDTDRKYVLITKYIGSQQRVIIPSTIDDYPVKAITTTALKNCTTAEYIYIPSTIVEIGSSGIGDKYKVEADAFSGCNNLNTVEIDSNNQYYANNNGDGIIYNKAKTKIYYCPNAKEISSLTIADGVTTICTSAFAKCKTLNELVMPESLISINNNAFRNCENLLKVTLKNGIKNIGHGAFGWCEKLTQINIPNTVETIDDYAFEECHELTNINIPSSVTSISTSTFHNCHKLISINVSSENNSYTNYNDDGILYDKNMKTIVRYPQAKAGTKYTIPDNITEIADKAFWRCSNLTQVTIPNTVTTIGESAFHYCENLTQITIPYNVTKLQRSTFGGCTNLSKVNLPDSIIAIDSMTFSDCTSLTEIEIPGSTTSMENTIFSDCTNLKRVIIPDSVTSMGYNIFHNDTNIKIVTKSNSTAHQYATSNSIAVELDNTSPTIQSITYSTKETTNGSVKVTITANEPLQRIVSDNRTWEYVPNTEKKSITAQISSNTTNEALTIKDLVGNTATATINVNNIDTTPPVGTVTMDKDSYKSGETATITAVFNEPVQDGTPQIVIARNNFRYEIKKMTKQNNYTYVYYHDTAKLEGDQRVEISEACDLAGNVMETVSKNFYVTPTLKRIDVTTQPNKNTYTVGENFDTTGMKITAVYGDNTSKEVTDYTVVDGTNLQLGKTCVIISYTDGGITKTVLVFISVVENIDNLFEYKVISDGGYISITKYIGNKQSVTIPSMINNYPVKTIAQLAFKDCTTVKYIYIPSSIEGIGTDEIGDTAKYESSVFVGCSNLNTVEIDPNNQYYNNNNEDGVIYDKNKTKLYYYPTAKTGSSFTIIDGVTSIEQNAFADCKNINTIVTPKGLATLGAEAFLNCANLSKITLNEGLKTIEANAFGLCESLEEIKLPSTVETIGLIAFQGCIKLTKIDIPISTTFIEPGAFLNCSKLASINVDSLNNNYTNYNNDGVLYTKDMTTIVRYPQAKSGTEYTISNNTTKIDYQAFKQCNNLTKVEMPDILAFIDASAFENCSNLQQITIPEGITELSYFIFSKCSSLKEVNLPDTLKEISRSTFDECTSLKEIIIPENVTRIADFTNCTNLNKAIIPDSGIDIMSGSFSGAENLTIVTKSNSTAHQFATNNNINVELDDISPTIESIVYSPDEITSGSVKVTITANEPLQKIVSDNRAWKYVPNTDRKSITTEISSNTTNETITLKDLVGNTTTAQITTTENIDNEFEYNVIDSQYVSITKYIGNKQRVIIPSTINNYPVKTIAQTAFKNCTTVEYIYIPSSIEGIGINKIGDQIKAEASTFIGCSNLNTVEIDSNNQYYTNNNGDGVIYDKNKTKLYYYPTAKTGSSFTIINGITSIKGRAFADCKNINTIVTPEGLTIIGAEAFANCKNLSKITLNEGLKTIDNNAFGLCESLEEIKLPSTVETIGLIAFEGCIKLTKIDIPSSTTRIDASAFLNCSNLASINVDSSNNSYTNYNNDGVLYTKDMTTIVRYPQAKVGTEYTISSNTTKIDYQAFEKCYNLTKVEIPGTVTFIGAYAFSGCRNLQQITIPEGVTEIGDFAFHQARSLTKVTIPKGVSVIKMGTFMGCTELTEVTISKNVITIQEGAFNGCTSLTEVIIPGSTTSIYNTAFDSCLKLNKIIIPDSVISIGDTTFNNDKDFTIFTKSNSTAHQFATNNNINVELDDTSPTIESIVYSTNKTTDGSVKVTITANEPIQDILSDGRDWEYVPNTNRKSIMAKMQNNIANEELTIKDLVGNKTTVTVNTKDTDTDTTPPTVTITTDKEKYNSGETVVITATFNEPIEDGTPTISILQNNVTKVSEKMSKQNEYTYTYSYNTTTASGEQKIIISEACDLAGNVMESKEKSIYITTILTKIEVTTQPSKTTYIEGQNFDKTGMKVTATYNNGTTKEVTNYTITDGNNLTVEKTSVTVGYTEDGITKTTTVPITVNKKSLSKIDVTTQPSKTTYIEGQNFDKVGMKVTATYSDGTSKEVTNYTITDGNNLTVAKTSVTVSYTEDGVTKTTTVPITVNKKSLSKIDVTTQPSKITYIEGQNFDKTGMKVTATYNNGTTKEVTNYTITDGNNLTVGKTSVTVSYTEDGITKTTTVKITVTAKQTDKLTVEFNQYNEVDNNNRKYLCNISPETTLEKMKENITTNGTIKVYSNNKEITGSKDLVTTSMKLEISLDDEKLELTIVVKGDTNGDGKSDLYDILEINKHRLNKALLTNERLLAGDVDNNNKVDIDDILRINKFRLGKINVL